MNHFGRFRIINDTPRDDPEKERRVVSATFRIGDPPVLKTVVGFGTQFPELPAQYYAETEFDPGELHGMGIVVELALDNGYSIPLPPWELAVGAGIELKSVDVKVKNFTDDGVIKWNARATVAGWNFQFDEPDKPTFQAPQ